MFELLKNSLYFLKLNKKGSAGAIIGGIIIALIVVAGIIFAVYIYTQNQTHPFWEIK